MKSQKGKFGIFLGAVIVSCLAAPHADAQLIGANFGPSGAASPTNWTLFTSTGTQNNLINENGVVTSVSVTVSGTVQGFSVSSQSASIPTHTPSLSALQSNFFNPNFTTSPLTLTFSGLNTAQQYSVYVFGLRGGASVAQTITITGAGTPIVFDQTAGSNILAINGLAGSSSTALENYGLSVTPSSTGNITITAVGLPSPAGSTFTVAGAAIGPAAAPEPGSLTLAALGFLGLAGVSARRRKK